VVTGLLYELDSGTGAPFLLSQYGSVLTWNVGGHLLSLGALVAGLVQLAVVLAVAAFVYRRPRSDQTART